jgi:hypothetical protein
MEKDYIVPTKERPIFIAFCDHFGVIDGIITYKDWCINNVCGSTFATSFKDAVNYLHEWIEENRWCINEYPKCKFEIEIIDGTFNERLDEVIRKKVYSITANKSKKLLS